MANVRIVLAILPIFLCLSIEAGADPLEDLVQKHEMTLAEMSCFKVDVLARPSDRPWGTEYDMGWQIQRSGSSYKFTTTLPGIITDATGNNPVQGQFSERLSNESGMRFIVCSNDKKAYLENARKQFARVVKGDQAYISGQISQKRVQISTALMNPLQDFTLPEILAKVTQKQLTNSDNLQTIRCKLNDVDYAFSIDPQRNYMISRVEIKQERNHYTYAEWVKDWTQIDNHWLPKEIEIESSHKIVNRLFKYSNWSFCDPAVTSLELKFLPGSPVVSPTQIHFWGEDDQPEASFPIEDEQAWRAYENRVLAKYGRSETSNKGIRVFGIVAFAAAVLAGGYWLKNR